MKSQVICWLLLRKGHLREYLELFCWGWVSAGQVSFIVYHMFSGSVLQQHHQMVSIISVLTQIKNHCIMWSAKDFKLHSSGLGELWQAEISPGLEDTATSRQSTDSDARRLSQRSCRLHMFVWSGKARFVRLKRFLWSWRYWNERKIQCWIAKSLRWSHVWIEREVPRFRSAAADVALTCAVDRQFKLH